MGSGRKALAARWLTRRQVAEVLGVAEDEVERLDGRALHPKRSEQDRAWRYDPAEVRSLAAGASRLEPANGSGAEDAAAFELFEAGKTLPQVVIATKLPAERVAKLRSAYDLMAGELVLSAQVVANLRRTLGPTAVASGEKLAAAIEQSLQREYEQGFADGLEEADGAGEVVDPKTGVPRKVRICPRPNGHDEGKAP